MRTTYPTTQSALTAPSPWQPSSSTPIPLPPHCLDSYNSILIIGSGITGALLAYHLLTHSTSTTSAAPITLLTSSTACTGATARNGRHTKVASHLTFRARAERLGLDEAVRWVRMEEASVVRNMRWRGGCGGDGVGVRVVGGGYGGCEGGQCRVYEDPEEVRREFGMRGRLVGAIRYPAGSVNAYQFTLGVLKRCVAMGLHLYENTTATSIRRIDPDEPVLGLIPPGLWTATTESGDDYISRRSHPRHQRLHPHHLPSPPPHPASLPRTGYDYLTVRRPLSGVPSDAVGNLIVGGGIVQDADGWAAAMKEDALCVLDPQIEAYLVRAGKRYFAEEGEEAEG
ncbi:hypothetical protein P152DRAFT_469850 [Eremomyces bilateralis CBS 781.70]|uniref:FAD dependent oxidoreductase domain-containing protein n=1 Tax=Eremomyces bilateralis CBS 781.70 TaxID=1392243 RepID=A0A6G1GHR8_9PEZI|nr:uncharacterized protein P152DRAFT_469850 [Eremomyces bilateralis CBS 781.70]KAF1817410.1 hypothetical protein P152DRAFT_469850 [Eremomyces bilateralis CBS 781.70]